MIVERQRLLEARMRSAHWRRWDPHWRGLIPFHEYFHGDNGAGIGASQRTGWTGLVAKLLPQSGA